MSGGEKLSLDEFATAPRRQRAAAGLNLVRPQSVGRGVEETVPDATVVDDQGRIGATATGLVARI